MKKRNREINIFSMSALDLFASGMGAFILLAVMALPFFPNTGDSQAWTDAQQEELERAQDELEQTQEQLSESEEENGRLSSELAKVRIPDLDIVICIDVSGSMREEIDGLKQEINNLAKLLDALAPSVGIGVVAFGDRLWNGEHIFDHNIVETSSLGTLVSFINGLSANMGQTRSSSENPDFPEALNEALGVANNLSWRSVSERRYLIVVSDAPAYPNEQSQAISRATSFAASGNGFVSTVYYKNPGVSITEADQATSFLRRLSEAGSGEFVNGSGGESFLANLLLAII